MALVLLLIAVIIIICILSNRISSRLGIPMLLVFIGLGMLFGSDGLVRIPFDDYGFAEQICSVALIFIMFYGGFGTNWKAARPVAGKAICLSSLGVVITAGLTGLFCHFVLGIELLESFLIGSVIGSTDAASVFSILRSKQLNLKYGTASMLEVESGSNDPFAYMLTVLFLSLQTGQVTGSGPIVYMIFAQIVYGALLGWGIAYLALAFFRRVRFVTAGFDAAFVLAIAILSYALPTVLGGNGYLSAYIVGIILGNSNISNKRALVNFFDGITGLMQMLIFFLLGLLSFPSQMPPILLPALAIFGFVTLIGRPLAVFAIFTPAGCPFRQQLVVSWAGLRGAASIVFAIMVTVSGASFVNDIFHIVFCIVLLSISLQGSLLPLVSRKLKMIDHNANVLKTFTDYQEETEIQFIRLNITANHPWVDKTPQELVLPPDMLLVILLRGRETIIPSGTTLIQSGDIAVLSAPAFHDDHNIQLQEIHIDTDHPWAGKQIAQISLSAGSLIIMIRRNQQVIVPNGNTKILADDTLVLHSDQGLLRRMH